MPRWERTCLRAFLGSKFCSGKGGNKRLSPRHNCPRVMWRQRARRGIGEGSGTPSPGLPIHTPIPNLQGLHLSFLLFLSSFLPQAPSPFPSNPLPSQLSSFSQQPSSQPALPAPISPPPSPPRPFQHPRPSSSHPFPAPTSVGWGAWGAGPLPSQSAAAVVAGGCVSASVGVVGAKGATGFGGVLAPADGGEVRVGGWAHSGRNGGGLSPQLPPSLPAVSLRAGAAAAAIPPTPPQRLLVSGAGQEVGGGDGRPILPIASQEPRHLLPTSTSLVSLAPLRESSAGLFLCLCPRAPAASFFPP